MSTRSRLLAPGTPVPTEFRTPDAWLRRQRLDDAEADLEAVLASKEKLRVWCDDAWPHDDFTLDENRDDLAGHIADARSGVAYGFTIRDAGAERVIGSLYLEPTAPFLASYEADDDAIAALARCDVRVECWLREGVDDAVEGRIVAAVEYWLESAWPFRRPCWGSRAGMTRWRARLESLGLVPIATLRSKDDPGRFVFHARPTDGDGPPA